MAASPGGVAIELRSLSISAGGQLLLDEAEAVFPAGQVTLIIGRSGAGKSLLLQLLAGTLDSSNRELQLSGQVLFRDAAATDSRTDFVVDSAADSAARGNENSVSAGEHSRQAKYPPSRFSRTGEDGRVPPVGVVYQHFALFDELSPQANVRFARDHRVKHRRRTVGGSVRPSADDVSPENLLAELGVPLRVRVSSMSGGQQQRLAIARTLAFDPEVILYDEPTSGLDAATADQVAELLGRTHASHPRTSVIVTHDYTSLPAIADRIYLFDADARKLRPVPRDQWPRLAGMFVSAPAVAKSRHTPAGRFVQSPFPAERGQSPQGSAGHTAEAAAQVSEETAHHSVDRQAVAHPPAASHPPAPEPRKSGLLARAGGALLRTLEGTTRAMEAILLLPWRLLPLYRSPKWGLRYFLHYLKLVAGPSAWLYLAIAGAITGFVSTWFTFRHLPYAAYTEPLVIEDLLVAIGFAQFRILVPVLGTVLIAARCGAAISADVGSRAWGRQLDAMRTFRAPPERYLLTGLLYAFLLGTPVLIGISFLTARLTSLLVFALTHPEYGPEFWRLHYHGKLMVPGEVLYAGTYWLLAKVLVCAAGIGLVAWHRSARTPRSHSEVSSAVTVSILWSTLLVLVVQFAFSFFEFD